MADKSNYSLTKRLLFLVIASTAFLWSVSFGIVWFGAWHELEEIINVLPSESTIAVVVQAEHQELLSHLLWGLLAPFLIGIPVLALLLVLIILFSLQSTRQLSKTLQNRSGGDLKRISSAHLPTEMLPLIESLNALLGRVEKSVEIEKRFTANAAHELRTPLATMRAQAQVAAWTQDAAARAQVLEQLQQTTDHAAHLLDQLLALARLGFNTGVKSQKQSVDLTAWLRTQMGEAVDKDAGKHEWELIAPDTYWIETAPDLLGIAVRNLLDNAANYSPGGGMIQIFLQEDVATPETIVLNINDAGPGMTEEEVTHLGERFFRGKTAYETAGSGLGWSIVYAVAEQLDMRIAVQGSGRLSGFSVFLYLPGSAGFQTSCAQITGSI